MKEILTISIIFLFLLISISALCEEGQIDINSASTEKLEEIIHVGPKVAGYIIEKRPFNSIDDLIEVAYISEGYLEDIKEQGLACVNGQEKDEEDKKEVAEEKEDFSEDMPSESKVNETRIEELETIILNPQVIKRENNKKETSKNYALYGFVAFCILIAILFITKKRKYKNEFR